MKLAVSAVLVVLALITSVARATTWDEPWQEQVIKDADTFIRAKVTACSEKQMTLETVKRIAGAETPATLIVDRFSLLDIRSMTVGAKHSETSFRFAVGEEWYFFLKKTPDDGKWAMATPTSGHAGASDGNVYATYRHSYDQALVPEDVYEPSMTAIFQFLHGGPHDAAYVEKLFQTYLAQPPHPTPDRKTIKAKKPDLFFLQHVALESFYYFGTAKDLPLLEPFLKSDSQHVRRSAVRALSRIDTDDARKRMWEMLAADGDGFSRVLAVWGLKRQDAREYLPKLRELAKTTPEDETGFGGNIMDPRVGTAFPRSVRAACEALVDEWSGKPEKKPS